MTPEALVRLLADASRRSVLAAVILGAADRAEVMEASGLDARRAATAIDRLVEGGLMIEGSDGSLVVIEAAFTVAARATAASDRPAVPEAADGADAFAAKVFSAFVRDGRLTAIPVSHAKRQPILDLIAQEFEPGQRYSEKMVNLMLGKWHADTAALRRYLVDDGYLDRADGQYWRAGGRVDI